MLTTLQVISFFPSRRFIRGKNSILNFLSTRVSEFLPVCLVQMLAWHMQMIIMIRIWTEEKQFCERKKSVHFFPPASFVQINVNKMNLLNDKKNYSKCLQLIPRVRILYTLCLIYSLNSDCEALHKYYKIQLNIGSIVDCQ